MNKGILALSVAGIVVAVVVSLLMLDGSDTGFKVNEQHESQAAEDQKQPASLIKVEPTPPPKFISN